MQRKIRNSEIVGKSGKNDDGMVQQTNNEMVAKLDNCLSRVTSMYAK
jgi:hypothetical protein